MFCLKLCPKGGVRNHAAVAVGHKLYSFGDYYSNRNHRFCVQVFNTVLLRWMPAVTPGSHEVPPVCHSHTAALIEDAVYICGGVTQ